MNIPVPETIDTPRLTLRRYKRRDEMAFIDFMTDEEATRYLLFKEAERTVDGARERFERALLNYGSPIPVFALAVASKDDDRFVGACGLNRVDMEPDAMQVFYDIIPAEQGKGYATEAARAMIEYAREHGVAKLVAFLRDENARAVSVAKHLGFEDHGPTMHHGRSGRRYVLNLDGAASTARSTTAQPA